MKNLVYVGDLYFASGTVLSSIYEKTPDGYKRYDWGFVQRDLALGLDVMIRQGSPEDLAYFQEKLAEIQKRRAFQEKENPVA